MRRLQQLALHVHEMDLFEQVLDVLILDPDIGVHANSLTMEAAGVLPHDPG